jgi:hypothetical protein
MARLTHLGKDWEGIAKLGSRSLWSGWRAAAPCVTHFLFEKRLVMGGEKIVEHMRQILLWPVYLLPLDEDAPLQDHWEHLAASSPGNPWHEVDDEFGDPAEFQERHYNEFVTFLPPVQRFLYGQGIGHAVRRAYGESPIRVMRRTDITRARVTLEEGSTPVLLDVVHVDLYFFFDIDLVILVVEVAGSKMPLELAQEVLFRFGRAYPAYWEKNGQGGHCPWKVEWLSRDGSTFAVSDYGNREKYLSYVCKHRAACVASHWEALLTPLVLYHSDKPGVLRYRQLEYYRMPYMVFLGLEDPERLGRADHIRLALGNEPAGGEELPYSQQYLADFEERHCYDRYFNTGAGDGQTGTRFLASGNTLTVLGSSHDAFFMNSEGGMLGRFRHQHFLMFLIAHFQKAALRMFSDRLVAAVSRLDLNDEKAGLIFRRDTRHALENFLRFAHRYWFLEISNQAQTRELFDRIRGHLNLDTLYAEVREELQDMGNFLDVEAMRRQNETVVRLTVVTTFGLIGTVVTGFLGMNLFGWSEEPAWWRAAAFFAIFMPATFLTLYTVMKSRRLSDFLDALSDERASWKDRFRALRRVWAKS